MNSSSFILSFCRGPVRLSNCLREPKSCFYGSSTNRTPTARLQSSLFPFQRADFLCSRFYSFVNTPETRKAAIDALIDTLRNADDSDLPSWGEVSSDLAEIEEVYGNNVEILVESGKLIFTRYKKDGPHSYNLAVSLFTRALQLEPKNFDALFWTGRLFQQLNHPEEALRAYETALSIDPNSVKVLTAVGILYGRFREFASAIRTFLRVLEIEPQNVETMINMSSAYIGYHEPESGLKWLKKARQLQPKNSDLLLQLGYLYNTMTLPDEAIRCYKEAEEYAPEDPFIQERLGDSMLDKEMGEEAVGYFTKAISMKKEGSFYRKLAQAYLLIGEPFEKCVETYREAMKLDKSDPETYNGLALLYAQHGDSEEATKQAYALFKSALAVSPNHLPTRLNFATYSHQQGDTETAISLLRDAKPRNPFEAQVIRQMFEVFRGNPSPELQAKSFVPSDGFGGEAAWDVDSFGRGDALDEEDEEELDLSDEEEK